ncbi:MAG: hypothetical protein KDD92_05170 [Caldilineaceae bacterium]|nr:hypothetical protein [Caldilineaceae bacterium]
MMGYDSNTISTPDPGDALTASRYLTDLAAWIAAPYAELPGARAGMVTGSAAKGLADYYSDLDMTMYYAETLPTDDTLAETRRRFGAAERKWLLGDPAEGSFAEAFDVNGIEVQIGHTTIAAWEAGIDQVLVELDCATPLQKALEGTLACQALFGEALIHRWKERIAAYPPELAQAMVRHNLRFFPLWALETHFRKWDATIWYYETLVEMCQHLVGVLAGLNRLYFTTFQFKRATRFIEEMSIRPRNLAPRLDALFRQELDQALPELKALVTETVMLVEAEMPDIDTEPVRSRLARRHAPWQPTQLRMDE